MKTKFPTSLLFSILLLSIFKCGQVLAEVKASTSQKAYYQGDLITLKIESNKSQKEEPNLTTLEQNFDLKGTSANSQISIVNGKRSYKKIWNIELQAKATGKFTIPEIQVGKDKTEAIEISINKLPPEVAAETKKHIFIEAAVDIKNSEIYVQQQIPYTVKFFYDAAMQTGEVVLPIIENANLRIVGDEKKYQVVQAGTKYVVVERRYVISPEKSGELTIPPTIVQGRMALTNGDSSRLRKRMNEVDMLNELFFDLNNQSTFTNPFDPFFSRRSIGPTRPYKASSESIQVNVLPVPQSFTGAAWLPAEEVKMKDSWEKNPPTLKVGEPVTRTIIMQVKGLGSSQIPEIFIPKPNGMRAYPEQAKGETPNDGNTIYGIQRVEINYIPDKSGPTVIPEITVDWWDVNNKQQQTFTLPGWNLNVAAGAVTPSEMNDEPEVMADFNPEAEVSVEEVFIDAPSYWGWEALAALIMGILILLGSLLLFLGKHFQKLPKQLLKKKKQKEIIDERYLLASLLKACEENKNKATAELLIKHTSLIFPEAKIHNLGVLAKNLEQGSNVINELEKSIYASDSNQWNGKELQKLLGQGLRLKQINKTTQNFVLAPLYPN